MGWDVTLQVWFKDEQPAKDRFIALVIHLEKSIFFTELFRLIIRSRDSYTGRIAKFDISEQVLSREQIETMLKPYTENKIGFEGWWCVKSHYFNESDVYVDGRLHQHDPSRKLVERSWRMIITVPGKDYDLLEYSKEIGMVCNIGNERFYSPRISKDVGRLNILSVIHELSVLTELNVATIRGLNVDDNPDPRTFYLSYHSDPNNFCKDMTLWTQHLTLEPRNLTKQDIIIAVNDCNNIEYLETIDGIFVYHQDLVDGNLAEFYTVVLRLLGAENLD
jgi:hypothetical protein